MVTAEQIHKEFRADLMSGVTEEEKNSLSIIGYREIAPESIRLRFPLHKIISQNKAVSICQKYNLKICPLGQFVGSIPQKNVKEVNDFVKQHMRYNVEYRFGSIFKKDENKLVGVDRIDAIRKEKNYYDSQPNLSFYICAPENLIVTDRDRSDVVLMSPDPIILAEWRGWVENDKEFDYRLRDYRIIVTAWGIEASDENVVNEKNN